MLIYFYLFIFKNFSNNKNILILLVLLNLTRYMRNFEIKNKLFLALLCIKKNPKGIIKKICFSDFNMFILKIQKISIFQLPRLVNIR